MTASKPRGVGSLTNAVVIVAIVLLVGAIGWRLTRGSSLPPYQPVTPIAEPAGTHVLIAAGDIGTCDSDHDEGTARVVEGFAGTVLALGDNQYESGTPTEYRDCYDPTWGRFKERTRPVPGNHEWLTPGAAGYFGYFGPSVGTSAAPWYAFDLGDWRLYALDSDCAADGVCDAQAEAAWFSADLAANPRACSLAYWHHPRFSSGRHGDTPEMQPLWAMAAAAGVDLVLQGHDHLYERFAPIDGIRSFVLGTGGAAPYEFHDIKDGSEVRNVDVFGILVVTLRDGGYDWRFQASESGSFVDSGSDNCH